MVPERLMVRYVPAIYSPEEVCEIMDLIGATELGLSRRLRVSTRTVRRMRENGAEGAKAAALNAFLRLQHYGA